MFLARKYLNLNQSLASVLKPLYGIGRTRYKFLLNRCSISRHTILKSMSRNNVQRLANLVDQKYSTNEQVRRIENKILRSQFRTGSYKGIRKLQGLPCNGQRTHSNHRTPRRMKAKYFKLSK